MKIINKKKLSIDFLFANELVAYKKSIEFMEKRVDLISKDRANEAVWFLEHPPIYTAGRSNEIKTRYLQNIPILNTNRGGKVTWHGPGQRIIYFMINIRKRKYDIRKFVLNLEKFIIKSLRELKIKAFKKKHLIGIWTKDNNKNDAKIASLGLRVSKGIIYHGLAINIDCDLSYFKKVDVCGIKNSNVTSISSLKKDIIKSEVDKVLKKNIKTIFA